MTTTAPTLASKFQHDHMRHGRQVVASEPLVQTVSDQLIDLCKAAGFAPAAIDHATNCLMQLTDSCGDQLTRPARTAAAVVADDHLPVLFSVGFSPEGSDVQILIEAHAGSSMSDRREAGLALTDRIAAQPGVKLDRFHRAAKLFVPEHIVDGSFALWHSVSFSAHRAPIFKAYFNPKACGESIERELVRYALQELGFGRAWPTLESTAGTRGPLLDEVKYLALDLNEEPLARIQAYFVHHQATPAWLASACSRTMGTQDARLVQRFITTMTNIPATSTMRPPTTCHSLSEKNPIQPTDTAIYLPACPDANGNDNAAPQPPIVAFVQTLGMDPGPCQQALARTTSPPTRTEAMSHRYAGTSYDINGRRLSTYLVPQRVALS